MLSSEYSSFWNHTWCRGNQIWVSKVKLDFSVLWWLFKWVTSSLGFLAPYSQNSHWYFLIPCALLMWSRRYFLQVPWKSHWSHGYLHLVYECFTSLWIFKPDFLLKTPSHNLILLYERPMWILSKCLTKLALLCVVKSHSSHRYLSICLCCLLKCSIKYFSYLYSHTMYRRRKRNYPPQHVLFWCKLLINLYIQPYNHIGCKDSECLNVLILCALLTWTPMWILHHTGHKGMTFLHVEIYCVFQGISLS